MNLLKIYGISIVISAVICLIIFDIIGVSVVPLRCLLVFLTIIHLCSIIQIVFLIYKDRKLILYLKLSFDEIASSIMKSAIISLLVASGIYFLFERHLSIFFNFLAVGVSYGLVSDLTIKSRNSNIWCAIVLSLAITAFIFHSLFLLNLELSALLGLMVGGHSLSCVQCRTWWSYKLVNKEFIRQFSELRFMTMARRGTATGSGADLGRRFDIELSERVPYYKIRKVYRKDFCCEVCGGMKSHEVIK